MDDDIVLPSDPEELEEWRAEHDPEGYWADVIPAIAKNLAWLSNFEPERGDEALSMKKSSLGLGSQGNERVLRSDDEAVSGPPKKRVKLLRSFSDENLTEASGESSSSGLSSQRRVAQDISNTTSMSSVYTRETNPLSPEKSLTKSRKALRKPLMRNTSPSPSRTLQAGTFSLIPPSDDVDDPALEDHELIPQDEYDQRPSSQSYVIPSPNFRRRSSPSPDPLLLLTQLDDTVERVVTPPLDHSSPVSLNAEDDPEDDLPITGPLRPRPAVHSAPLAPSLPRNLSPPSSPLSSASPSPRPSPLARPTSSASSPPPAASASLVSRLQQEENTGRYRLRERNVRQLKPYAYDKQLYNHQMRANPEAIVKFRSPTHRRHRSRAGSVSAGGAQSSDAEVDPAQFEADASDEDRPRRRRAIIGTADESGGERVRARSRTRSVPAKRRAATPPRQAGPSRQAAAPTQAHAAASNQSKKKTEEWFRAKLNELASSEDSSDSDLELPSAKGKEKGKRKEGAEEARKKRRRKRFPMRLDIPRQTKSPSTRQHSRVPESPIPESPSTRQHSQTPESPAPRLLKRRSLQPDSSDVEVLTSVRSPSRQPSPDADPWGLNHIHLEDQVPSSDPDGPPESSSLPELDPPMDVDQDNFYQGDFDFQQSQDRDDWGLDAPDYGQRDEDMDMSPRQEARDFGRAWPRGASPTDPIIVDPSDSDSDDVDPSKLTNEEFHKHYRRKHPQLYKMYPPVQVRKMILSDGRKSRTAAQRGRRASTEAPDDAPLQPGKARVRVGSARNVVIKGDSESEDEAPRSPLRSPSLEAQSVASQSPVPKRAAAARMARRAASRSSTITIESSSEETSEVDDEGDSEAEFVNCPVRVGEAKEGTLVDYMLNRTGGGRQRRKQASGKGKRKSRGPGRNDRPGGDRRGGGSVRKRPVVNVQMRAGASRRRNIQHKRSGGPNTTRVVLGSAKKYGPERQTLLNFPHLEDTRAVSLGPAEPSRPSARRPPFAPVALTLDLTVGQTKAGPSKPAWKKARHRTRDRVYFLKPHISTIVSGGHAQGEYRTTVLEQEVSEAERRAQAIMHFPLPAFEMPQRKAARQHEPQRHAEQRALPRDWRPQGDANIAEGSRGSVLEKNRPTIDMGISTLPSGIAFAESTYLGRGYLHVLLSPPAVMEEPTPGYIGNTRISSSISAAEFSGVVSEAITEVLSKLENSNVGRDVFNDWQRYLQVIRPWSVWFLSSMSFDGSETLRTALQEQVRRIYALVEEHFAVLADASHGNMLLLQLQWTAVELLYRMRPTGDARRPLLEDAELVRHVKLLVQHLWACNLDQHLISLWPLGVRRLDYSRSIYRIAEFWICLIHMVEQDGGPGAFWALLLKAYQGLNLAALSKTKYHEGEAMWMAIYSFIALSQFSLHGATTSTVLLRDAWAFVVFALQQAPLAAEPIADAKQDVRKIKQRDRYVKLLLLRCVRLHTHWRWALGAGDSAVMFNKLLSVFKSRRFANLLQEKATDFPSFLNDHKLSLLQSQAEEDSAFTSFLKLIVQAAKQSNGEMSPGVRKILELVVPLGSVPFNKSRPASLHELSMLYNRLSALAVAIYLEPTPTNARNRLTQARRYVNFKETDEMTRWACIRGAMHLAILLQHFELPLTDALEWLGEMTNVLVEATVYTTKAAKRARNDVALCIQMILGSARRIIETPRLDDEDRLPRYPEPALLQGPWVTRVFAASANRELIEDTALEMCMLVQVFLKARTTVVPRRQPERAPQGTDEESQEYGDGGIDWNQVIATWVDVDEVSKEAEAERNKKEEETCKVIEDHIAKAVFRVLCAHLSSQQPKDSLDIGRWVECWVGCAEVLVRNGRRDWGFYITQASQTWGMMDLDSTMLRRMNVHFSSTVLRLDFAAYTTQQDHFLKTLFACLAVQHPELEAEYVGLVLTADGLEHPLLRGLPCEPTADSKTFELSRLELIDWRAAFLDHILSNLDEDLSNEWSPTSSEIKQMSVGYLASMLSTMQDIHESLDLPGRVLYAPFCSRVLGLLSSKPNLAEHSLLKEHVTWLRSLNASRQV